MIKEMNCTEKCIAMIVWSKKKGFPLDNLLLVERRQYPFGLSFPGGHLEEGENFEQAAARELKEETGLVALNLKYLLTDIVYDEDNNKKCSKGSFYPHECVIYRVSRNKGSLKLNKKENKSIGWYDLYKEVYELALKTRKYLDGRISEEDWQDSPGLTPVCYRWLTNLGILRKNV